MTDPTPLKVFLGLLKPVEDEMADILRDAAEEAERLIPKLLEKHTKGSVIRAAQLAAVLREIRSQQSAMWGALAPVLRSGQLASVKKAATLQTQVDKHLAKLGVSIPGFKEALEAQAVTNLENAKFKSKIPLSSKVYQTQALAQGMVDRRVKAGIALGKGHQEIAKDVRDLILPTTPGGVSYAAKRLARTELNNAFHAATIARHANDPWTIGFEWHLSGSHPKSKPDICNRLAGHTYPKTNVPDKPHPNCLCYITAEQVGEEEFFDAFIAGDYNTYLDRTLYGNLPDDNLPC